MTDYYTIKGEFIGSVVIEKSKFICYVKNVNSKTEAEEFIRLISKKNSLATHNCYAYVLTDNISKFSDDKEPQGTAGLPIYNAIVNSGLKNVCAVVTRYFGGIKLGTGGLSRAYSSVTTDTLKETEKVLFCNGYLLKLVVDYDKFSKIKNLLDKSFYIKNVEYDNKLSVSFVVKKDEINRFTDKISDAINGAPDYIVEKEGFFEFQND